MQNSLLVNNMYAAYSATSSNVNNKSVSNLSKMLNSKENKSEDEEQAVPTSLSMDKVIISNEALAMLRDKSQA